MKKKFIIVIILVSVVMPFQLLAQNATQGVDVFRQELPMSPEGRYFQEGIASWYGREFEGRPTASGEIFDASQMTAAHPSLPFGTRLIITNQHNNKSVTVRVNDRGPFVPARIIDVSRAAAEQLDMIVTGTAPVTVVSIDRMVITSPVVGAQVQPSVVQPSIVPVSTAQNVQSSAAPVFVSAPVVVQPQAAQSQVSQLRLTPNINIEPFRNYRLQVGSFRNARNAVDTFDRLKNAGLNPAYERFTDNSNVEFYRVVLAGIRGADIQITAERISAAGFREAIIREEN
ncbi:MAG: septal ring lytic transglycosylase RlpA family protein [Treponema sp.]|nr:septal ring lytic transglycosylase RlpA family protein [Treponema sp.]